MDENVRVRIDLVDGQELVTGSGQIDYEPYGLVISDPRERQIVPWGQIKLVVVPRSR